jgi:ubiquinone/menaquinone biosynthesis C-methylase UbiE
MKRNNRGLIDMSLDLLDIQHTDRILEIGFGPGYGIQKAAEMANQGWVAGIELSETMLMEAKKLNWEAIASDLVELKYGDASSLPYGDKEFDKAFAVNVLYFWDDPLTPLAEMKRVIRPGGRLLLGIIDREKFQQEKITQTGEFTLYNGEEAVQLLVDAGFSNARFEARDVHDSGMAICAIAQK